MLFLKQQQFGFIVQFQTKPNHITENLCSFIVRKMFMLISFLVVKVQPNVSTFRAVKYRSLEGHAPLSKGACKAAWNLRTHCCEVCYTRAYTSTGTMWQSKNRNIAVIDLDQTSFCGTV